MKTLCIGLSNIILKKNWIYITDNEIDYNQKKTIHNKTLYLKLHELPQFLDDNKSTYKILCNVKSSDDYNWWKDLSDIYGVSIKFYMN